jgi:hypothetical protein
VLPPSRRVCRARRRRALGGGKRPRCGRSDKTKFCNSVKWGTNGENVGTCIEIMAARAKAGKLGLIVSYRLQIPIYKRAGFPRNSANVRGRLVKLTR